MSDIKAQIEFLQVIQNVTEEFDAAYETRKEDPERWEAAKSAFQEQRSFWRTINRTNVSDEVSYTVAPGVVSGDAAIYVDPNAPVNEGE